MKRARTLNRNWLGESWRPSEAHLPRTHDELRLVLERAVATKAKVGVIGRGYSCAPAYRTHGIQIGTSRLDHIGVAERRPRRVHTRQQLLAQALRERARGRHRTDGENAHANAPEAA